MTIIEQIYEIVKSLPQEPASEILTFAEFIQNQHLNANQSNATLNTSTSWEELAIAQLRWLVLGGTFILGRKRVSFGA